MPSKKKKYNARFPAGRIKKIMQTDEEVGKVAQAVPIIISRTLELFVESLLTKAMEITNAKNAKTLSPSHMKQCILSESRFDFLKDLVANLPDVTSCDFEDSAGQISLQPSTHPSSNSIGKFDSTSSSRRHYEGASTDKEDGGPVTPLPEVKSHMNPNFYKENEEADMRNNENRGQPARSHLQRVYHSATEVLDVEDSGDENEDEYKAPVIVPQYAQTAASTVVDEDYDT